MNLIKNGKAINVPRKPFIIKDIPKKEEILDTRKLNKSVDPATEFTNVSEWQIGFDQFKNKYGTKDNFALKTYLSGKVFKFFNKRGLVNENLHFHSSGRVYGHHSLNEVFWGFENGKLVFTNNFHKITTQFKEITNNGFKGDFLLEDNAFHILEFRDLLIPNKNKFELVIAKYKEDVSWSELFEENRTIYSKSPFQEDYKTIKLENIGREANTYLFHIVNNYNNLAEYTMFLQGYPFDHRMFKWEEYFNNRELFIGTINTRRSADSGQYRFNRGFMTWFWGEYVSKTRMPEVFGFGNGAMFSVHKSLILRKPIEYWKELLVLSKTDIVKTPNGDYPLFAVGYMLEVMWRYIFESEFLK